MPMSSYAYEKALGVDTNLVLLARLLCIQDACDTVPMSGCIVGKPLRFEQRDVPVCCERLHAGVATAQQPRGQRSFCRHPRAH